MVSPTPRQPDSPVPILGHGSGRSYHCGIAALLLLLAGQALAGGGVLLRDDTCIISIGFYDAHFTAYQPEAKGDTEFCENLPDTGKTIFVLDYLHSSLKEVPVDFRIIRNVTGKGEFARQSDIEAIADLDAVTVFYQPPIIKENATFLVEYTFAENGEYIGIVTAGHPSNANIYTSIFPFAVGAWRIPWGWIGLGIAVLLAAALLMSMKHMGGATGASET